MYSKGMKILILGMKTTFVLALHLFLEELPYPHFLRFSDEKEVKRGIYLQRPIDAISDGIRLFVADDEGLCVYLITDHGVSIIGGKGTGPGYFRNQPERLELKDETLLVHEFNFWDVSGFSLDGTFLWHRKNADRSIRHAITANGITINEYLPINGSPSFGRNDCFFGFLEAEEPARIKSAFQLAIGDDGTVVMAHGMGRLATVDKSCHVTDIMALNLLGMAKEPEPISGGFLRLNRRKIQLFTEGVPLIAIAAKSVSKVWVLVRNEKNDQRFLYEVDLNLKEIVFKVPLEHAFDQLRYANGVLLLLSRADAIVEGYRVR